MSWLNPYKEQKLVIVGSNGMLVFDDTAPLAQKLVHYPHTINWENGVPVPQKAESISIDLSDIWDEPLKLECRAFLKAIETGDEPVTSGAEGLRVLKILELSQQSIEQKESITHNRFPITHDPLPDVSHPSPMTHDLEPASQNYFVHPTAIVDEGCEIGFGTKIWHFSHVLSGSKIGENCNIGQNVVIGPDVTIGNNCKLQNNVSVYKGVTLEDGVFCGPAMVFTNVYNPRAEIRKMDQTRPTVVKKGATLGANCTIICGVTIGRYAFVGGGALVNRNVPDYALVVGNPAKHIGYVCECGERVSDELECVSCGMKYQKSEGSVRKILTKK